MRGYFIETPDGHEVHIIGSHLMPAETQQAILHVMDLAYKQYAGEEIDMAGNEQEQTRLTAPTDVRAAQERIAQIKARLQVATDGPWQIRRALPYSDVPLIFSGHHGGNWTVCVARNNWPQTEKDFTFIASAREDIPWLLAQLDICGQRIAELEGEKEHLQQALRDIADLQPSKPETRDFEQDDIGARAHARAMAVWKVAERARAALDHAAERQLAPEGAEHGSD